MAKDVGGTHAANITLNTKNAAAKNDRLRALVRFKMTRYGDYNDRSVARAVVLWPSITALKRAAAMQIISTMSLGATFYMTAAVQKP